MATLISNSGGGHYDHLAVAGLAYALCYLTTTSLEQIVLRNTFPAAVSEIQIKPHHLFILQSPNVQLCTCSEFYSVRLESKVFDRL